MCMDENRLYLHDREKLLCEQRASGAALMESSMRGLLEGAVLGAILSGIITAVSMIAQDNPGRWWWFPSVFILSIALVIFQRYRVWKQSTFRITTERILLQEPVGLWEQPVQTIKWPQYQESHVARKSFFDYFFFSRPLAIRYGTADAKMEMRFPSLKWGYDLKHYLDKVDSAFRAHQAETVPAFVAAPRGKRDGVAPAVG